ncbi:hypothetical protein [Agathobacter sp.]
MYVVTKYYFNIKYCSRKEIIFYEKNKNIFISVLLSTIFIFYQIVPVYGNTNSAMTNEEVGNLFSGIESIVTQLEDIGLSAQDISDIFHLQPKDTSFYTRTSSQIIPYSGTFVKDNQNINIVSYRANVGNAPTSDQVQRERIENIYSVALQYYKTDFYQGHKSSGTDFGNYLTYLYLSHYIDGPGRTPTQSDLPFIISQSDINAYDTFLRTSNLSSLATEMTNLGVSLYSDYDYINSLNAINTVDVTLKNKLQQITMLGYDINETRKATLTIAPLVKKGIIEKYATANSEEELTDDTLIYVKTQLEKLDFYKTYDEKVSSSIISILTSAFIGAICNSISLIGICVSIIPLFVYDYTGLIQTAVLVNLQYSFSARYAIRTDIYLDM